MKKSFLTVITVILLVVFSPLIIAQTSSVPTLINYQGFLTDPNGTALDSTVDIEFWLYDTSSGGLPLWTEEHTSVSVENGLFNIILGSVTSLSAADLTGKRYLAMKVGLDAVMETRLRLTSAAYSILAERAHALDAPDGDPDKAVFVDYEGNVGIGTTTPESKLQVNGVVQASPVCARWLSTNHGLAGPVDYEWGHEVFNSDSSYLSRTPGNNKEIEVKIAGYYMICVNVLQSQTTYGRGDVYLRRNVEIIARSLGMSTGHIKHTLSIIEKFEAGDKIAVQCYSGSTYGNQSVWSSLEIYRLN
jgi:hypothetical protein